MVRTILIFIAFGNVFCLHSQNSDWVTEVFGPPAIMPIKKDLCRFVLDRIVYPQSCITDTIQGVVSIDFFVETNGETTDHRVVKGVRADLNEEALRVAKLLIFDEPAYTRAIPIHFPVRTAYSLIITFYLDFNFLLSKYVPLIECSDFLYNEQQHSFLTYNAIESAPEYNRRGFKDMLLFITENVQLVNIPENADRVTVLFLVDTLGYTSHHEIVRSSNPELDNEALRVARLLKFEKPAMQRGKPVNFIFTLPFDFRKILSDKQKADEKKK